MTSPGHPFVPCQTDRVICTHPECVQVDLARKMVEDGKSVTVYRTRVTSTDDGRYPVVVHEGLDRDTAIAKRNLMVGLSHEAVVEHRVVSGWKPLDEKTELLEIPPFDVSDFRENLQRRISSLETLEAEIERDWLRTQEQRYLVAATRVAHKRQGLQIALDMLPKHEPEH
jgi:hypothetical protein